jgi:predicted RNase H-like nuclease (RuvC/YqgF family)
MRPAEFSTENPPRPIDCLETKEYIASLRRRIEVQNDSMEHLAVQVHSLKAQNDHLNSEVERLSLDLGIRKGETGPGWQEVKS